MRPPSHSTRVRFGSDGTAMARHEERPGNTSIKPRLLLVRACLIIPDRCLGAGDAICPLFKNLRRSRSSSFGAISAAIGALMRLFAHRWRDAYPVSHGSDSTVSKRLGQLTRWVRVSVWLRRANNAGMPSSSVQCGKPASGRCCRTGTDKYRILRRCRHCEPLDSTDRTFPGHTTTPP